MSAPWFYDALPSAFQNRNLMKMNPHIDHIWQILFFYSVMLVDDVDNTAKEKTTHNSGVDGNTIR
jgi:hypothetical protein